METYYPDTEEGRLKLEKDRQALKEKFGLELKTRFIIREEKKQIKALWGIENCRKK